MPGATDAPTKFVAGGTNLLDLMKADVMRPGHLVDITRLPRDGIVDPGDTGLRKRPALLAPNAAGAELELERWESWVRSAIALQELLSGLGVLPTANGAEVWYQPPRWTTGTVTPERIAGLIRPPTAVFDSQVPLVKSWAALREERAAEIVAQIDNQFAFLASVLYLHPARTPRTFELLAIAIQMTVHVEMRLKHALACHRPSELSPQIQPMITTPGHGSLPSGHTTQAYLTVHVLKRLLNLNSGTHANENLQLDRQAARIATNRVIAGAHFPVDSIAGVGLRVSP